jgi:hypothetical protein
VGSNPTPSAGGRAGVRFGILRGVRTSIATYGLLDPQYPYALFGAVVDRGAYGDYEERAYEEVLNKFDDFLARQARVSGWTIGGYRRADSDDSGRPARDALSVHVPATDGRENQ